MEALTTKYQPQTLGDFRGLGRPKRILQNFASQPTTSAWLLVGPSGLGKTTIALALQKAIGGALYHIPSRQCDLATVEEIAGHCAYRPWNGGRFNTVIVDEADQATKAAQIAFLSLLDSTAMPDDSVWIFTANSLEKLEERLISRCRVIEFTSEDIDFPEMLDYIWSQEAMGRPSPDYTRIIKRAKGNVRTALMELELELLDVAVVPPVVATAPVPVAPAATGTRNWFINGIAVSFEQIRQRLANNDFTGVTSTTTEVTA